MIGFLEDIVFEVNTANNTFNLSAFDELTISGKANFGEHNILRGLPKLEFTGVSLDELSFNLILRQTLSKADIVASAESLKGYMKAGKIINLVIGSKVYGKFIIESLNQKASQISNKGRINRLELDIKLKEYN